MQNQNEAQTRANLIDPKLEVAGYTINHTKGVIEPNKVCVEVAVTGMPITEQNPRGNGFVDYVIFGNDGNPLALIEAKKTLYNEEKGKVQACLYADCLEKQYGVRPIIYYTNGYSVKVIDGMYPARRVFGFHNFDELEHLIQRRQYKLIDKKVNPKICDRYYQKDAIGEIIHHLEAKHSRSLLVLATGTGKTRVSCALSDIFIKNNYVIIEYLASFRSEYYKKDLKEKINNDGADVVDIKNKIKSTFENCIKRSSFYDGTIDLEKENKLYFTWRLEKGDLQSYFAAYLRQLPNSINLMYREQIEKRIKPLYINNHALSEEQIDKIRKLTPVGRSAISGIYNKTDELQKIIDSIPTVNENMVLPLNFFFKSNAIRLNAEYDDEDTMIRPLKDEEIDYIIDQDYQMVNGLYRYSEFTNDTTRSFLVTREELKEILKSKIRYAFIVFKAKIIIDNKKCLWFDRKKKD